MHITIFEEKAFLKWFRTNMEKHKESILKRACGFLLCSTSGRKDIKKYTDGEKMLFNNLDLIKIDCELKNLEGDYYNTCLVDKYFTICYNGKAFESVCLAENLDFEKVVYFFSKLSHFITDAVVVEWKMNSGVDVACVKVENPKVDMPAFFPVSYSLMDLISTVEVLSGKKVAFTTEELIKPKISSDTITCHFSFKRLMTDYIIAGQLVEVYLNLKGFVSVDKLHFTYKENWIYDMDTFTLAYHLILQNKTLNLLLPELYPIYEDKSIYDLLNFECNKEYLDATQKYLCAYFNEHKVCSNCYGVEDLFKNEMECPLYTSGSILDRFFTLNELSSPEKQLNIVNELIDNLF